MAPFAWLAVVAWLVARTGEEQQRFAPREDRPLVLCACLEDEPITPGTARFLKRAIRSAEERQAECLIVALDTPGGLLDSTRAIVKEILASRACVVVYVSPRGARAASAGVFLTLASHVAAMAPGTTIGAAHPVQMPGLPIQSPSPPSDEGGRAPAAERKHAAPQTALEQKIANDAAAWAQALAEQRKRNSDWAARAVSESLSVTASKAVAERVVDLEAADLEELLKKLAGREVALPQGAHTLRTSSAKIEEIPMWWGERMLAVLSLPNVAFLLLVFGFYGVLFELSTPSWGVAGTLGVICLLLAFYGLAVMPVNYLGLALVIVALALFAGELFVTTHGMLTVGGIVCLVLGGLMLVDSPVGFLRVSLGVVLPVAAAVAAITLFLVGGVLRAHGGRVQTGDEGLLGILAEARTDFAGQGDRYVGKVFVRGEWWNAESDAPLAAGQECRVEGRQGLTLNVKSSGTGRT